MQQSDFSVLLAHQFNELHQFPPVALGFFFRALDFPQSRNGICSSKHFYLFKIEGDGKFHRPSPLMGVCVSEREEKGGPIYWKGG